MLDLAQAGVPALLFYMALNILFMGTAELACASLKALVDEPGFAVLAAVTQPDRPAGRDLKPQPSAVKKVALAANLPVLQPERARDPGFIEQLRALAPDLIVVAAYGQILPKAILEMPRYGCINVHTSLLPKYRGAAPIQWAILNGDPETGVTIMKIAPALDSGDILSQCVTPITPEDNAETLHDRLAELGAKLLIPTIHDFVAGKITPRAQVESEVTHVRKITKEDGHLDWTQPARSLWNRIRAFTPWPGAYSFLPSEPKPRLLKIWQVSVEEGYSGQPGTILSVGKDGLVVACGSGALRIQVLQREGGRRMPAGEFLAGNPISKGVVLK